MGWKDVARLASEWAEAKKTELLTTDRHTREGAGHQAERVEEDAKQEAVTSLLENVLPPSLAEKVTAARPENVAARRAEREQREAAARRERLAGMVAGGATAELTLTISGGEQGTTTVTLPCERHEEHPEAERPEEGYDEGPPPLSWLRVSLEAPDPVPVGSTTLSGLTIGVPAFAGPGRYDLVDLWERSERGEIGWWEALDVFLSPHQEADDACWFVDVAGGSPAVVDVAADGLRFDLPMASAISTIRATGSISW